MWGKPAVSSRAAGTGTGQLVQIHTAVLEGLHVGWPKQTNWPAITSTTVHTHPHNSSSSLPHTVAVNDQQLPLQNPSTPGAHTPAHMPHAVEQQTQPHNSASHARTKYVLIPIYNGVQTCNDTRISCSSEQCVCVACKSAVCTLYYTKVSINV